MKNRNQNLTTLQHCRNIGKGILHAINALIAMQQPDGVLYFVVETRTKT